MSAMTQAPSTHAASRDACKRGTSNRNTHNRGIHDRDQCVSMSTTEPSTEGVTAALTLKLQVSTIWSHIIATAGPMISMKKQTIMPSFSSLFFNPLTGRVPRTHQPLLVSHSGFTSIVLHLLDMHCTSLVDTDHLYIHAKIGGVQLWGTALEQLYDKLTRPILLEKLESQDYSQMFVTKWSFWAYACFKSLHLAAHFASDETVVAAPSSTQQWHTRHSDLYGNSAERAGNFAAAFQMHNFFISLVCQAD